MQQILDLHIHSKYSRACSPSLNLENIDKACRVKGVDIIATGDFTYPDWFLSIKNDLEEVNNSGLYKLKSAIDDKINPAPLGNCVQRAGSSATAGCGVKFILSTELALIYKQGEGHARRLHIVVLAPNISAVEKFNKYLANLIIFVIRKHFKFF